MRTPDPLRIAVVGLGYWGPNLVRNLYEIEEGDVVCVCDLREDALEAIGRRHPGVQCTTSYKDVLADPEIDAVVISTPVSTHYALTLAALQAGKHVLVEKPLAASSSEAEELIEMAREQSLVLMPGHTFLYSPPVNLIRDVIVSGELGDIYFITMSRVNLGLHQPDVSVIWDLAPHDFSILRYWLDESPAIVSAISRGCVMPGTPDVAFVHLSYESGVVANVELSWLAPSKLRRTAIVGSAKMVIYDDTSNEPVRVFDSSADLPAPESFGEYRLTYRTGDIVSRRVDAAEPLALELADFCRSVRGGTTPRSHAYLGLDVVRAVEAVDDSLRRGGLPAHVRPAGHPCETWA